MRRQLEERSESAWCLVRKLRVLLIIVKELARALWLEPLCRVHVVYRFRKELGMTSRTWLAIVWIQFVSLGQCRADIIFTCLQRDSRKWTRFCRSRRMQLLSARPCISTHFLRLFSFF